MAEVLLTLGRGEEAEAELREGLRRAPNDADTKLLLARAYRAQAKYSAAHVVLEDMIKADVALGRARVEKVRVLVAEGEIAPAVRLYRRALVEDPDLADAELSERLGVSIEAPATREAAFEAEEVVDGRLRARLEEGGGVGGLEPLKSELDFSHVGGMDELKQDIRRKVIHPLQHPELYQAYGKQIGGGILLYGPPGCGKTHLARATAGEIDATFLAIGIHDVLDMWIGQSERNLHQIFELARSNAPCVLFFDEADALGASRSDFRTSAGRQTINQFLAELDGVGQGNDGVLILAATNAPWQMDPAFRRPGRFDRVVFVPPPDARARTEILRILMKGKPQRELDLRAVAKKTDGFSGADLSAVVDTAVESKLDQAIAAGAPTPLVTKDLLAALKGRKPTTSEWFRTVRNYVLYANDDGLYDEIKPYLKL